MIYFVCPSLSSFVKNDIEIFSKINVVKINCLNWANKKYTPFYFLYQFFDILFRIRSIDFFVISFAGYHSFLPVFFSKIFKKKVFIIQNGTESVAIKELNYGSLLKRNLAFFCKYSMKNATELWPVSESLIKGSNIFLQREISYGISVSMPKINFNFSVIPNGFNINKWPNLGLEREDKSIITVISNSSQFELKGIDLITEFVKLNPSYRLTIVGINKLDKFEEYDNILFTGKVDQQKLVELFSTTKYYFQLSAFEGFGCSLCEAMLSGCIPIGSNVNEIPKIIGYSEGILLRKSIDELTNLMSTIEKFSLQEIKKLSVYARNQITKNYSIQNREEMIMKRLKYNNIPITPQSL